MRKSDKILLIGIGILTLFIIVSIIVLSFKKTVPPTALPPIQVSSPSPSSAPFSNIPDELKLEKIKQENYAKDREEYLKSKPWVLRLPLKSGNYFVSYNPNSDSLLVELYYSEGMDKDQQLLVAKQTALSAILSIGIDTSKQKIEYLEIPK